MNWGDERYVRLYTRDTADWLALPWQSRAVWPLLLKKADRSGLIDVANGPSRVRRISALIALPVEVTEEGLRGLLEDRYGIRETDAGYFMPNFVEAQEARQSDAQRQRESRARRRAAAELAVTKRDSMSRDDQPMNTAPAPEVVAKPVRSRPRALKVAPDVTIRDSPSQSVTESHTRSHDVTPCLAVPMKKDRDVGGFSDVVAGHGGAAVAQLSPSPNFQSPAHPPTSLLDIGKNPIPRRGQLRIEAKAAKTSRIADRAGERAIENRGLDQLKADMAQRRLAVRALPADFWSKANEAKLALALTEYEAPALLWAYTRYLHEPHWGKSWQGKPRRWEVGYFLSGEEGEEVWRSRLPGLGELKEMEAAVRGAPRSEELDYAFSELDQTREAYRLLRAMPFEQRLAIVRQAREQSRRCLSDGARRMSFRFLCRSFSLEKARSAV
jgi:hypothetical protein